MLHLGAGFYFLASLLIFLFSMVQLTLIVSFLRRNGFGSVLRKPKPLQPGTQEEKLPFVTVQLPLYNERYVVERLIDCVAAFDYPADRFEVQVLDDSNDDTVELAAKKAAEWQAKGINVLHIRRPERVGYKAGALAYGMKSARGELIAIFDADFLPPKDFLRLTVPHFRQKNLGLVQTRWGHINEGYSSLTELQAFGLNGHFVVEQTARNLAGSFINFNGTAGVWRRRCIENAGGWSADTLTEDLDLSFRAQMKGWKFKYLPNVVSPAELPVVMSAIKSQQYRWNKGGAETARKHLWRVLKHPRLSALTKLHGIFHLVSSSVFVMLFLSTVLSLPVVAFKESSAAVELLLQFGILFTLGFLVIGYFYWLAARLTHKKSIRYFVTTFPRFIALCMGLSLHNSIAVMEGWLGFKSPFVRTPKFNITEKRDSWMGNVYVGAALSPAIALEGLLGLYFFGGVIVGLMLGEWLFSIFMLLPAYGFSRVFLASIGEGRHG